MKPHEYTGKDLAFLIPTKDRPQNVEALLQSLAAQTVACGRVIVVDGGESIEKLVLGFRNRLAVEYYACRPPGQIRQRNLGISKLGAAVRLVGFLDDDLALESDAVDKMLAFWNSTQGDTAGVGFNIVNAPPYRASLLGRLFFLSSPSPGRVLRSGYNTRVDNIDHDLRTQWLGGGYAVWKREILEKYPQPELDTRWAIGEDLRFSYPIGKTHPLWVCADAKARLMPVFEQQLTAAAYRYRGYKGALHFFYFVCSHPELSRIACLWMLMARICAHFALACMKLDATLLHVGIGESRAVCTSLGSLLGLADLKTALEDRAH